VLVSDKVQWLRLICRVAYDGPELFDIDNAPMLNPVSAKHRVRSLLVQQRKTSYRTTDDDDDDCRTEKPLDGDVVTTRSGK